MSGHTFDGEAIEVERAFREVYGHAVATLVRFFGDITVAEDAVQDAFVVAAQRWRGDGIPANPAGWIVTTARNRAIDQLRRSARGRELCRTVGDSLGLAPEPTVEEEPRGDPVADDRLRLIFTCCHPALRTEHQVALTLRLLGGLTVEEIASGFLVTEPAMAKRLVRALVTLMPDEPEVAGLLAIMVLNESRVPARRLNGAVVLLRDQDRSRWNHTMIDEGHSIVRDCIRRGRPGPYQLQAATQAMHCNAETFEATDWDQIVMLYDHLYLFMPSPVVALNRAIAITETEGPEVGLAALDVITPELENYFMLEVRELPDDNGVDRP